MSFRPPPVTLIEYVRNREGPGQKGQRAEDQRSDSPPHQWRETEEEEPRCDGTSRIEENSKIQPHQAASDTYLRCPFDNPCAKKEDEEEPAAVKSEPASENETGLQSFAERLRGCS